MIDVRAMLLLGVKGFFVALRHCLAWHDNPKGGWGVCYDEPYPWGGEAVPECRVITEKD